jgi:hypothetical protein
MRLGINAVLDQFRDGFQGLLCESAMMVMAFQSSPILSLPRRLPGSPAASARIASVNAVILARSVAATTSAPRDWPLNT